MPQHHPDDLLCYCLHISTEEVEHVVESGQVSSLRDVKKLTGAGSGCTACHCAIRDLLGGCRNEKWGRNEKPDIIATAR